VLALVVSVMGRTYARIGNAAYARSNHSYGLTTLQCSHVRLARRDQVQIRFMGKAGRRQVLWIGDRKLVALIRHCHDLPGRTLFQYVDDAGQMRLVDSGDVNDYLQRLTGNDFSAKDFRTWGATLTALIELARLPLPENADERERMLLQNQAIASVAGLLGNTPAVCRKSYIDSRFHVFSPCRITRTPDSRIVASLRVHAVATCDVCGNGYEQAPLSFRER